MKTSEPSESISKLLALLPAEPGVYVFKNAEGEIIYIGKALSLRSRVRSYWNANAWYERPKLAVMMPKVADFGKRGKVFASDSLKPMLTERMRIDTRAVSSIGQG